MQEILLDIALQIAFGIHNQLVSLRFTVKPRKNLTKLSKASAQLFLMRPERFVGSRESLTNFAKIYIRNKRQTAPLLGCSLYKIVFLT